MKKQQIDTRKFHTLKELKKEWMKDPGFRQEYENLQPEMQVARQMIQARISKKLNQDQIARRVGTGQAVISRLETGIAKPSISLLRRVARALDTEFTLVIR